MRLKPSRYAEARLLSDMDRATTGRTNMLHELDELRR
jgi:hypothetical protein